MKNKCNGVYTPQHKPSYDPCSGHYTQTDCVSLSKGIANGLLDLSGDPNLSEYLIALTNKVIEQEKEIERMRLELEKSNL